MADYNISPGKVNMPKPSLLYIITIFALMSCTSIQKIGLTSNKTASNPPVESSTKNSTLPTDNEVKFINDISLTLQSTVTEVNATKKGPSASELQTNTKTSGSNYNTSPVSIIENASLLQIKYSILLGTEIEEVSNLKLFEYIDEWLGTRYCMGGTTKNCIDCSAFVQAFFSAIYGMVMPRTAREQYKVSTRISRTEMQEGDLLFFNTRGGISHVGIYLQNNKFVHAGSSEGVTISDIFDPYWVKRFIGVGRVLK